MNCTTKPWNWRNILNINKILSQIYFYRSKDGRPVSPGFTKQLQDGNKYTLFLSEALPEDSGSYTCTASNPVGRAKESVQLMVRGKKLWTFWPLAYCIVCSKCPGCVNLFKREEAFISSEICTAKITKKCEFLCQNLNKLGILVFNRSTTKFTVMIVNHD